jgi:hypothetical protein
MKRRIVAVLLIGMISSLSVASCNLASLGISIGPTPTATSTPLPTSTPTPTVTPTPEPVVGIDGPVVVRGIDLTFVKVEILTSYKSPFGTHRAGPPYSHLILVEAHTDYATPNDACLWNGEDKVFLSFTKDGQQDGNQSGICISNTEGMVQYFFAGYEDGEDLVVALPDGVEVPLQSLLE